MMSDRYKHVSMVGVNDNKWGAMFARKNHSQRPTGSHKAFFLIWTNKKLIYLTQ